MNQKHLRTWDAPDLQIGISGFNWKWILFIDKEVTTNEDEEEEEISSVKSVPCITVCRTLFFIFAIFLTLSTSFYVL